MDRVARIFLSGLATVIPVALTLALLVWLGVKSERVMGTLSRWLLPDFMVFPGMGVVLGLGLIFGVGVLMQWWVIRRAFDLGEAILERIPLVKTLYGSIRDVMQMFAREDGRESGKPVIVRLPGHAEALLGFVTRDPVAHELGGEGTVAVYLPMSYQIGGYTVLLPKEHVEPVAMGAQDAMRFVLTAGMGVAGPGQARRVAEEGQSDGQ